MSDTPTAARPACLPWTLAAPLRALIRPAALYGQLPAGPCHWLGSLLLLGVGIAIGLSPQWLDGTDPGTLSLGLAYLLLMILANTLVLHGLARFLLDARVGLLRSSQLVNIAYCFFALKALPLIGEQNWFMLVVLAQILLGIRYLYLASWTRTLLTLGALFVASLLLQSGLRATLFADTPLALPRTTAAAPTGGDSDLPTP